MLFDFVLASYLNPDCNTRIIKNETIVVEGQPLFQEIININDANTKFYITVYLEEHNYKTSIPVINNTLPEVTVYKNNTGLVTKLLLDYRKNIKYNPLLVKDGCIIYNSKKSEKSSELRPMPKFDNSEYKSDSKRVAPKLEVESKEPTQQAPTEDKDQRIEELLKELEIKTQQVNLLKKEIDSMKSVDKIEEKDSIKMMKPSAIKD